MHILTRTDIEQLIDMTDVIMLMRRLFAEMANGAVTMPQRSAISLKGGKDTVLFMPGHVGGMDSIGIKIVSVFPDNPIVYGRSTINATVLLNDPGTGEIAAVMDGAYITALRTGAVSAVATDLLATAEAHRLGVFGAGVQARSQIDAIMTVRPITAVQIYDPEARRAQALVDQLRVAYGDRCRFDVAASAEACAADSDIVTTATTSRVPVFDGRQLAPGTHINAIGAFKPGDRELDDYTIARARIFVDSMPAALCEAGDLIIPIEAAIIAPSAIEGDLSQLVLDPSRGRRSPEDVTVFKSVGLAVEDLVVASHVFKKAQLDNVGTTI